jgi:hypothetical protein
VGESDGRSSGRSSYSRIIDFVYHPTLCLRVIKKKKKLGIRIQGWPHNLSFVEGAHDLRLAVSLGQILSPDTASS